MTEHPAQSSKTSRVIDEDNAEPDAAEYIEDTQSTSESFAAKFPPKFATVSLVFLTACAAGWAAYRVGSLEGFISDNVGPFIIIELFGWAAAYLSAVYLLSLMFWGAAIVSHNRSFWSAAPWGMLALFFGLVYWSFAGIQISSISIHAALTGLSSTRDQAFLISEKLYPLLPYVGLQALGGSDLQATWSKVGEVTSYSTLITLLAWMILMAAGMLVLKRGRDWFGWLLLAIVSPLALLLFLLMSGHHGLVAMVSDISIELGIRSGDRAWLLNSLTLLIATLSWFGGIQTYRLARFALVSNLSSAPQNGVRHSPSLTSLIVLTVVLLPLADLRGQFSLLMKHNEMQALAGEIEEAPKLRISAQQIDVRTAPSSTSPVVASLKKGAVIPVLERTGDWVRISQKQWVRIGVEDGNSIHENATASASGAASAGAINQTAAISADSGIVTRFAHGTLKAGGSDCMGGRAVTGQGNVTLQYGDNKKTFPNNWYTNEILACVMYLGEPLMLVKVSGPQGQPVGVETYSFETLSKPYGYFCAEGKCRTTAKAFPLDFPVTCSQGLEVGCQ